MKLACGFEMLYQENKSGTVILDNSTESVELAVRSRGFDFYAHANMIVGYDPERSISSQS